MLRKYVEHSCWPCKENFCDEEVGFVFVKRKLNQLKNSLEVEKGQKPKNV